MVQQVFSMENLICFTLGYNLDYLKLTKLCVDSLKNTGYSGDLLFITDMKNEILETITYDGNILFMETKKSDLIGSSSNKLKIHKYEEILKYNKVICCDLDTLWLKSPNILFESMTEDKFYVADDNHSNLLMSAPQHYYGDYLLTNDELHEINLNQIKGFSAGFFAFPTKLLKHLIEMDSLYDNSTIESPCAEQPVFNSYLWRKKLYSNSFNGLVSHGGYWGHIFNGVLIHFPGGIGNFQVKYDKMINYLKNIKNE